MGRFHVYITPFEESGDYSETEIEVTNDIDLSGLGALKQTLDNSEYDIGVIKNASITLALLNIEGKYSDAETPNSIFRFRRAGSKVRITWEPSTVDVRFGFAVFGDAVFSEEVDVFIGLLNDDSLKADADEQKITFKVLGLDSVLSQSTVPLDSLINGDTFSAIIYASLLQADITKVLTVDVANINCALDLEVDDIESLENKTVLEALKQILLLANSVVWLEGTTIHVGPREESEDLLFTFYGQGSNTGAENIIDLTEYRNGLNRTFNFFTWNDTSLVAQDSGSIIQYGLRKKEIDSKLITLDSKRTQVLEALLAEFAYPKIEMQVRAPIDPTSLELGLLDSVAVDYPNVAAVDDEALPLWDQAIWDVSKFPAEILPVTISADLRFKVLSRGIDPANQEIILDLREI